MYLARCYLHCNDTGTNTPFYDDIEHVVFVEKGHLVLDALLIQCLQYHMPRSVGSVAGSPHGFLTEV